MYKKSNTIRKIARTAKLILLSGGACVAVLALTYAVGHVFTRGVIDSFERKGGVFLTFEVTPKVKKQGVE